MAASRIAQLLARLSRMILGIFDDPRVQQFLFTLAAVAVGIMFSVRATYVASLRSFEMAAISNLVESEASAAGRIAHRFLGCLNLVASEDARYREAEFQGATLLWGVATLLLASKT